MKKLNMSHFLRPNDPLLRQVAEPVKPEEIGTPLFNAIIERMFSVAYGEQTDRQKPLLVGLAAPQIGISKRIILVDLRADGKGRVGDLAVFINPEITRYSSDESEWYEGCFSTGKVCGIVSRPNRVDVMRTFVSGSRHGNEFFGYTARIIQHEIDHLDGKEFISHISDESKLHWVEPDEFPKYRNEGGWRNWPNKCSFSRWNEIKNAPVE